MTDPLSLFWLFTTDTYQRKLMECAEITFFCFVFRYIYREVSMGKSTRDTSKQDKSFTLSVKTGDRPWGGTDATVYAVLHGEGLKTQQYKLDHCLCNDFERGEVSEFQLKGVKVRKMV